MAGARVICCSAPVKATPALGATRVSGSLRRRLWPASLVRGLVALGLGAYAVRWAAASPATVARIVAIFWIVEGVIALWAAGFAATLAASRVVLTVRGAAGIGAALLMFVLPLAEIFGPWRPGQIMFFLFSMVPAVTVIALQILMAAAIDGSVALQVRRRIPGEWSIALGAALSIVLGGLVAAAFFGFVTAPGQLLAVIAIAGGLGLVAGALWLRRAREDTGPTPEPSSRRARTA
jgi:uncharacterized membrane protein HdeD (DUF308 family)